MYFALFLLAILVAVLLIVPVWLFFSLRAAKQQALFDRRRIDSLEYDVRDIMSNWAQRVVRLEEEVRELGARLAGTEPAAPAAAVTTPPAKLPSKLRPADEAPPLPAGPMTAPQAPPATPAAPVSPSASPDVDAHAAPADQPSPKLSPSGSTPPPASPAPPSPPAAPPPSGSPGINWEQWLGIRGAAVLGGIVMALAAVLFLKYSIEQGLIPPIVRVAIGLLAGVGCLFASEKMRERDYSVTANALSGAGIVILYASVWAARTLYQLIASTPAYGLMILVTISCGLLSWRHRARDIALLGMIGGFLTPMLLTTGRDNPIGLFTYILLLDVGLLVLARTRRWPLLTALSLAGTVLYQVIWIFTRMGPDRALLGLGILGVFAVFYAIAGQWAERRDEEPEPGEASLDQLTRAAAVLMPFGFALYFAGRADLGLHLYPVGMLLLLLSGVAVWLSRVQDFPLLASGAASGSVAVVFAWMTRTIWTSAFAWEAVGVSLALALVFHALWEWERRAVTEPPSVGDPAPVPWPPMIAASGFFVLFITGSIGGYTAFFIPWFVGWLGAAALLVRQSTGPGREYKSAVAAFGLGAALALFLGTFRGTALFPAFEVYFAWVGLCAVGLQVWAVSRKPGPQRRWAEIGAATMPAVVLLVLCLEGLEPLMSTALFFTTTIVLGLLIVLAATRVPSGAMYVGAMVLVVITHAMWTASAYRLPDDPDEALLVLAFQIAAVLLFSWWPFATGSALAGQAWAWRAAAIAGPLWFVSLKEVYEMRFGSEAIALLPVALAALSLTAAFRARNLGLLDSGMRKRGLVWFSATAMGFVAVAIPLQLENEWVTIGWALQGIGLAALWKGLDHAGLKYFSWALLAAVTIRLLVNEEILDYHASGGFPIVNWLMYTYLIPAAALLGAAWHFRDLEVERRLDWEEKLYSSGKPVGALACGVAAIAVIFFWINLTIIDFFSTSTQLTISFERMAARDLTQSLAWALYALTLLAIGVSWKSAGLRWISLGFLILTIGKVFLHDLGELEDLYRVASLVGLALSLILVSLAYQRFVFRRKRPEEDA